MGLKTFLMHEKDIKRASFFWNAFAAVMNSFQTMVLLLVITRTGDMNDAGIFVMAYAIGNLMLYIGKYGVRQFQVTDVNEKYTFSDYIRARYVTMLIMAFCTIIYLTVGVVLNGYSKEKTAVVLMICMLKGIEAYEDVYHGRMQQKGRLDVAGRILGIRFLVFIIGFAFLYYVTHNLLFASAVNLVISLLICFILNGSVMDSFVAVDVGKTVGWRGILKECFPLCVCLCLNMYVGNAPKYIIDSVVSDDVQTCFNIVYMPLFVVVLLGSFIFQPLLKDMGEKWENGGVWEFLCSVVKLSVFAVVIGVFVTFLGNVAGCQVLGWIYGVDLADYRGHLTLLLCAGSLFTLQNLFIMAITTIRYQKYMIYGYIVMALAMFFLGKQVLLHVGLLGLNVFFLLMLICLDIYCIILIFIGARKKIRSIRNETDYTDTML